MFCLCLKEMLETHHGIALRANRFENTKHNISGLGRPQSLQASAAVQRGGQRASIVEVLEVLFGVQSQESV